MNKLTNAIILTLVTLTIGTVHASEPDNSNGLVNLSIKAGSSDSEPFTCQNSLANCLITMKLSPPNEGHVIIFNNSLRFTVIDVHAVFPTDWNGDIEQTSLCPQIPPRQSCTLYFKPTVVSSGGHTIRTIPIVAGGANKAFVDMVVIP